MTVKCNMCVSLYFDPSVDLHSATWTKDISLPGLEKQQDKDGYYWGCPKCKTDLYLMDIEDSQDEEL